MFLLCINVLNFVYIMKKGIIKIVTSSFMDTLKSVTLILEFCESLNLQSMCHQKKNLFKSNLNFKLKKHNPTKERRF